MGRTTGIASLAGQVYEFVRKDFHSHFWELEGTFPCCETWKRLSSLGTELWLDSGSLDEIEPLWTAEFCALTTNNTLLNKEVQRGIYDKFILEANKVLQGFSRADRSRQAA